MAKEQTKQSTVSRRNWKRAREYGTQERGNPEQRACEGNCLLPPAHSTLLKTTAGVGQVTVGEAGAVRRPLQRSRRETSMAWTGWWNEEKRTSWRNTQEMTGLCH